MAENVKVIVRCRPMNRRESELACKSVVRMRDCTVETWDPNDGPALAKQFTFDSVYDVNSCTEQIYNDICYPLIESVLEGYNSTVFVYGQTGCGKSFSMEGNKAAVPPEKGIISRAFEHIFEAISVTTGVKYLALASYLEIYNEQIRDLLLPNDQNSYQNSLNLKEVPNEGVTVPGLTMQTVSSVADCERLLTTGTKNRMIGATLMNQNSSRSHSIFTISIEQITELNDKESIRKGKLNLVDLAGSERQAKTGATGDRLKEATKINLSLSALGNVISALVDGKAKHIPYRDSKLTRLLQDSLGGNTRTLMIACIGPASRDYVETLTTLRYANRAKNISNKPRVNEDPKDTMLRQYQEEITELRKLLETQRQSTPLKIEDLTNGAEAVFQQPSKPEINSNMASTSDKLNAKRDLIISQYEDEMRKLKSLHETERSEKQQVLEQIEAIRAEYQANLAKVNAEAVVAQKQQQRVNKQEVLMRIEALKAVMIGGERADDKELSERRKKKKMASQRRMSAIAHVLAKIDMNEDRELLQNQYKDISQELNLKTEALRKYRFKVKSLDKEITDIQSEFEAERQDYLETIRKQQMQTKLLSQISEKLADSMKTECNYQDLEAIKEQAVWLEDTQKYKLPDVIVHRTKLPPAGHYANRTPSSNSDQSQADGSLPTSPPNYIDKFQRADAEELIGTYFKPKRAAQLLNQSTKMNPANIFNTWRDGAHAGHVAEYASTAATRQKPRSTESNSGAIAATSHAMLMNGMPSASTAPMTIKSYHQQRSPKSLVTNGVYSGSSSVPAQNSGGGYWFGPGSERKPLRLEALPSLERRRTNNTHHTPKRIGALDI